MTGQLTAADFESERVDMADEARDLVELTGYQIVPLWWITSDGGCACPKGLACDRPGKHTWLPWKEAATADPMQIGRLWRARPLAGIALLTGTVNRVRVIDIDGVLGEQTLRQLEDELGPLPETVEQTTGNGRHLFFECDDPEIGNVSLGPKLDTRANGGYVVLAPSLHRSGRRYQLHPSRRFGLFPLARLSEPWSRARKPQTPTPRVQVSVLPRLHSNTGAAPVGSDKRLRGWFRAAIRDACAGLAAMPPDSGRNNELNKQAFSLAGYFWAGLDRAEAQRALEEAALTSGLERGATLRTIASAFEKGEKEPRSVPDFEAADEAAHSGANGIAAANGGGMRHGSNTGEPPEHDDLQPLSGDSLPSGVAPGTNLATAHLLLQQHGGELMFSPELGWCEWDSRRFVFNGTLGPSRRVQNIGRRLELGVAELLRRAASLEGESDRKRAKSEAECLAKWAKNVQSANGIRRALEVAQTLLEVSADQLDSDPSLLNVLNGTIDLRTGALREHRRGDKITRLAPVNYDPKARALRWGTFLQQILPNAEVRDFVLRFLGYSLTGFVSEQALMIALGSGANGKSVLSEIVRRLLGDYARDLPTDSLMRTAHGTRGTENDLARLKECRFLTAKETEQDRRLDEARVKALTGGDTISARFLYREFFEYRPQFKLWLHCNHKPSIRGTDDGVWRRIHLVPFGVTIPVEERDHALSETLWTEAPGILASLVRACLEWHRRGLQPPAAVRAATAAWRKESDDVAAFIADKCVCGKEHTAAAGELYQAYMSWVRDEGPDAPVLTKKGFGERLSTLGYQSGRSGSARYWRGLALLEGWS